MNNDKLELIRHSVAHIMAQAVQRLYPGTKVAIGPAIENGFYYDFDFPSPIKEEDLPAIEAEMKKIVESRQDFVRIEVSKEEALKRCADEPYKIELINDLPPPTPPINGGGDATSSSDNSSPLPLAGGAGGGVPITLYENRDKDGNSVWFDLCRGPHVENTREINSAAFKLMRIAGAYWRGDEHRPMLTRIYGTAFDTPKALKEYLAFLEEAEKRDHRRIGKELDLFHIDPENPGEVFWHPNGWTIYRELQNYVREKISADGYVEVNTPFVMPKSLWERSGHWAKYEENMFVTESEKRTFALKPMNCPGHVEIFKQKTRSYRDLPLRIAEFGSCTRNEPSGALHGIMRVRGFTQDDAHIFCTEEQIEGEAIKFCNLLYNMYADFGFEKEKVQVKLSTRPEKRIGSDAQWDKAEAALATACGYAGVTFEINPGEGAFYGPKLEFTLIDALGRGWQCGTFQLDYQLPSKERLDAEYAGEDGGKHNPVMLHRAVLGSLERFIGILLENFAGALPVWLCPEQIAIIPVADAFNDYAQKLESEIKAICDAQGMSLRTSLELGTDRMNAKIRACQTRKIPYMLVVGEREANEGTVSIRRRDGQQTPPMKIADFAAYVGKKIKERSLEL
ncbi:MAG: threonine--tRNA ligase [Spirochaetaceae bacterium]|jgi:threonyl-tRNA synthetase|nr:threonine--tRNA ligase [Spirochaetaceae bacterium]